MHIFNVQDRFFNFLHCSLQILLHHSELGGQDADTDGQQNDSKYLPHHTCHESQFRLDSNSTLVDKYMELSRHSRHPIHVVSGKERRDHTNLFQLIQLGFDQNDVIEEFPVTLACNYWRSNTTY